MVVPDVNVLLAAFRDEHEHHALCRRWLERTLASDSAFAVSDLALSACVRIATNPRALRNPNSLGEAVAFAEAVRRPSHAVHLSPGPRHWDIFTRLCRDAHVRGNAVTDAYFAALAIEHGCEWITLDSDFGRFADLKWRRPS
jgi:toxin-antitoxin system PIN domain toxin